MKRYFLDLRPYFDHRLVCPRDQVIERDGAIGIDRQHLNEEDVRFDTPLNGNGMTFVLRRNDALCDNIVCGGQCVSVPGLPCTAVHFSGFGTYGYYTEEFKLLFEGGGSQCAKVSFSDICTPVDRTRSFDFIDRENREHSKVFYTYPIYSRHSKRYVTAYLYYSSAAAEVPGRKLTGIVFPDNFLMNIFAITVEG